MTQANKKYYENNKDKILERNKQYRLANKEKIKEQKKQYNLENIEKIKASKQQYYLDNKEKYKEDFKQYNINHRNEIRKSKKQYAQQNKEKINKSRRERIENNIFLKLRQDLSGIIRGSLKRHLSSKNGRSMSDFLPYTMEDLKIHLESLFSHPSNLTPGGKVWMTWSNWGKYIFKTWDEYEPSTWVWHIDHIIPQSNLPYYSMEDDNFIKCWSLNNLRPLSADINIVEGATRIRHGVLHEQK